jgi:hypothetical protein
MVRSYAEPVQVQRRDDVPEQFLWRGRLYVVRAVLARWVEAGGWWRTQGAGGASTASALTDPEREYWRVEATAGRASGVAVLDLCFDWAAGGWTVARSLD